jgi:hypothetical protein
MFDQCAAYLVLASMQNIKSFIALTSERLLRDKEMNNVDTFYMTDGNDLSNEGKERIVKLRNCSLETTCKFSFEIKNFNC